MPNMSALSGISYRQWLVGMAMQGFNANPAYTDLTPEETVKMSFADADAVISRQSQEEDEEWEAEQAKPRREGAI